MSKLSRKIKKAAKLNEDMADLISELPNYGGDCDDSDHTELVVIHEESQDSTYCTECGGVKWERTI